MELPAGSRDDVRVARSRDTNVEDEESGRNDELEPAPIDPDAEWPGPIEEPPPLFGS